MTPSPDANGLVPDPLATQRQLVIISGAPGSGKSTLAAPLARALGFPLFSKDVIKETIFDSIGDFRNDIVASSEALDDATMSVLWQLTAHSHQAVVEANFKPGVGHEAAIKRLSDRPVEVYCRLAPEVALERYNKRSESPDRHRVHFTRQTTFEILARYQDPLGLGQVIEVDTTHTVEVQSVADHVPTMLDGGYPDRPVSRTTVAQILKNPYYMGMVTWRGEQHPGRHEPLVSVDLFERVATVLASNRQGDIKGWRHVHYLKGLLICGECGSRLSYTQGNGNGGQYEYFYCLGRQRRNGCTQSYVPTYAAEAAVERCYEAKVGPELIKLLADIDVAVRKYLDTYEQRADAEAHRQRKRVETLERQELRLMQDRYADILREELFVKEMRRISREREQAQRLLAACEVKLDDFVATWERLQQLARLTGEVYGRAKPQIRRDLNRFWLGEIAIHPKNVDGKDYEWAKHARDYLNPELPGLLDDERSGLLKRGPEIDDWDSIIEKLNAPQQVEGDGANVVDGSNVRYLVG